MQEETYQGEWKIGELLISSRCGSSLQTQPRPPPAAVAAGGRAWALQRKGGEDADSDRIFPSRADAEGGRLSAANRPLISVEVRYPHLLRRSPPVPPSPRQMGRAGPRVCFDGRSMGPSGASLGRTTLTRYCRDVWANIRFHSFPCLYIFILCIYCLQSQTSLLYIDKTHPSVSPEKSIIYTRTQTLLL